MNKHTIFLSVLSILFGVFMFVYGGYDDSPGAQLIGVLLVVAGVFWTIKNKQKSNS